MTETSASEHNEELHTWPQVLEYNFRQYGDRSKAMRYKHYGIWQSYTWQDYYLNVKFLSLGLLALGFKPGDKLLIVGDNAPEWYFAELAAQSNRGISVGLYADLSAAEIKYIAENSEAGFAMVEDQEQVDKLAQVRDQLPRLQKIIYWRYKGLSNQKDTSLIGYRNVLKLGREYEKAHPGTFESNIAGGRAEDICAIIYTSGTTGENPKGGVHSYKTLKYASECYVKLDNWDRKDNLVSNLPPAWITEQWLAFGGHLLSAGIVNFAEGAETQQQDIREIGPSIVIYNARLWERQAGQIQARIQGSGALKKLTYRLLRPVGFRMADIKTRRQKPGWYWQMLSVLANLLLLRPLRDSLGLPHARVCYTSGAILCSETFRFYHALNVPLKSIYGSTEAGAITAVPNRDIRPGTVGPVIREIEIKFTPSSEILVRHPGIFLGYYNNPITTAEVLKDGWVYTGDRGRLTVEGELIFLDRAQDIIQLSSGESLFPQDIESRLKYSPYIKDAWILAGPDREYASAVIIIDSQNTGRWADKRKVTYTTYSDLSQRPEVYDLVEREIARINKEIPAGCRIERYVNLHKEFDPDESELTHTRKLRRGLLTRKYSDLVKAIYSGRPTVDMAVQVKYQDGRSGTIKTALKIQSVKGDER
jgi:long-chain acyl-CoA synthetase